MAEDVCRLVMVIHTLGQDEGLSRGTVSDYLTSAKHFYTETISLFTPVSAAWGTKGVHHPHVTLALRAVPDKHRLPRMLLSPAWIQDGFRHCWTTWEYVAIALMYGWLLRVGEACPQLYQHHTMTWEMVTFYDDNDQPLPMRALRTQPCDLVGLQLASRKHQEHARLMPGRTSNHIIQDPRHGATSWCNLCMATILQGWAILNNIDRMTPVQLAQRPVLAKPGSDSTPARLDISNALKRNARRRGEDPARVAPHCLRQSPISWLANSPLIYNQPAFLRATGHKSMDSSTPYIVPGRYMAAAVTEALQPETEHPPTHPTAS